MCNLTESEIIELAAKTAIDCYKSQEAKNRKQLNDKRLRNTKLLLSNYRSFKTHSDSAVYTAEQAEDAIEILDLMWDPNNKSASVVESIKASCAKTVIIVNHIDTMILERFKKQEKSILYEPIPASKTQSQERGKRSKNKDYER